MEITDKELVDVLVHHIIFNIPECRACPIPRVQCPQSYRPEYEDEIQSCEEAIMAWAYVQAERKRNGG